VLLLTARPVPVPAPATETVESRPQPQLPPAPPPVVAPPPVAPAPKVQPATGEPSLVDQLVAADWDREAAETVVTFYGDWFRELRASDRPYYDATVVLLKNLKDRDRNKVAHALVKRPELLGLLAVADRPQELASVLTDPEHGELLASLFLTNLHRDDLRMLAAVLTGDGGEDGRRIARLTKKSVVAAEALFAVAYDSADGALTEDAEAYLKWLRTAIRDVSNSSTLDESGAELADFALFVLSEGPDLRDRLRDPQFRTSLSKRWETLQRLVVEYRDAKRRELSAEKKPVDPAELPGFADLAALPGIWEFASEKRAPELFKRFGPLAVDLCWPTEKPELRSRVADLLLESNASSERAVVDVLMRGPLREHLKPFIEDRAVRADLLALVAQDLYGKEAKGDGQNALVKRLDQLSAILKSAGPAGVRVILAPPDAGWVKYLPGYDIYRVVGKYNAGEEVSDGDLLWAAADVTTFAPGVVFTTQLVKSGAKGTVKNSTVALLKKKLTKEAAEKVGEVAVTRFSVWFVARSAFNTMRAALNKLSVGPARTVMAKIDVTNWVRFAYTRTKLGRETFKRFTGLEARLFMRADAKVFLSIHRPTVKGAAEIVLCKIILGVAADHGIEPLPHLPVVPPQPTPKSKTEPQVGDRLKVLLGHLTLAAALDIIPKGMEPPKESK
jgi:hypothetical protein